MQANVLYPQDPHFDRVEGDPKTPPQQWRTFGAHDPSVIAADGAYYAFSTGTFRQNFYQIRRSSDLIHWEYVGMPFSSMNVLEGALAPLRALYKKPAKNPTLWAPDVLPAADGGFWLYGCYSAEFGNNYSVIFLAHADAVCGEYTLVAPLVLTGGKWGKTPNAIDPQIFYDAEGRMFMTYGSWFGGIRILELDPATGLRKDGYKYMQMREGRITAEQYYGEKVLDTKTAEGSVVLHKKAVRVYGGDALASPEDPALWRREDRYVLMASCDPLDRLYNMRVWESAAPDGGYMGAPYGKKGLKVTGSFSWRRYEGDPRISFDFFVPGHNDLFTTQEGADVVACHCRTPYRAEEKHPRVAHHLMLLAAAFNARGELVVSPNRYAGERPRKIGREELLGVSGGCFDYIAVPADNAACPYARRGMRLEADGGMTLFGERCGRWVLFGENSFDFEWMGVRYSGAVLPAWIEAENRAGLTVTARGENGLPFFMNTVFDGKTE